MDSRPLRQLLSDIAHQLKRNKALTAARAGYVAAVDGHEFFSSRKRCCPQCQTPHPHDQGGSGHRILSPGGGLPLDRPGPGLGPGRRAAPARRRGRDRRQAAARTGVHQLPTLLRRRGRRRVVLRCAVHQLLPGPAQARHRHGQGGESAVGAGRRGVVRAAAARPLGRSTRAERTVQFWDEEGFTSCEGVKPPLRVLHTEETVRRRERIAGQWQETEETTTWSWATTLTKAQLSTRGLWRSWPCPLGYRERLLQHAVDALGLGSLLQARGDGDRQFPADVVHRVCLAAKLLAAEPQAGGCARV